MFSQNDEERIILQYFKNSTAGCLIDIGANDGVTYSNSRQLLLNGWNGILIDPSDKCYWALHNLYEHNKKVLIGHFAVGKTAGETIFYESGKLVSDKDFSLVSTIHSRETLRWGNAVDFTETKTKVLTWNEVLEFSPTHIFDAIFIDAEGEDTNILRQMNLTELGCRLLCIEHNDNRAEMDFIRAYCAKFGMNPISINGENIILIR